MSVPSSDVRSTGLRSLVRTWRRAARDRIDWLGYEVDYLRSRSVETRSGDLRSVCLALGPYRNLTTLLEANGATWHDVVRTSCYLRDIERDYDEFNRMRTLFFECMSIAPLPASTGIQARLCRSDLLIEMELFAIVKS